jgi:hypothetical protein
MHFFLHTYKYIYIIYICMCVYYYMLSDGVMSCHPFIMACMAPSRPGDVWCELMAMWT